MITDADGKYCPAGYEWFSPWKIRSIIVRGDSYVFCPACGKNHDIDDLKEEIE